MSPGPMSRPRKSERMQWCDYEPGDFPDSEFKDSDYGKIHLTYPLHNTAGETFGGKLPGAMRAHLEERAGGAGALKKLLADD